MNAEDVLTLNEVSRAEHPLWEKAIHQVTLIAALDNDWDGDGTLAIRREIIGSTQSLLQSLRIKNPQSPPNAIYPTPDGYVTLEWQFPDEVIQRIEIQEPGYGRQMMSYPDGRCEFTDYQWSVAPRQTGSPIFLSVGKDGIMHS